jgi:murein DD-endopeptidase MepM/ murein hydrolase activator NlpD
MCEIRLMRSLIATAAALIVVGSAASAAAFELAFPLDCTIGEDCAVQHYVDRDPGEDRRDYQCGHQTYDGHDGTDIRLPSLKRMAEGVAVLAAADGTVAATRDGMADRNVDEADPGAVKDRECGNGVLVEHADGWVTQYCHMKQGSIRVTKGDKVATGTPLGEVGLSGMTEFPHLHLTVRKDGEEVDPFAIEPLASGAACAFAGDGATSVWAPAVKAALAYRPAFVLNAGFSDATVEMQQVESGELEGIKLTPESPVLVFYGRAIGIEAGDVQHLTITAPDGSVFAEDNIEPVDRPKAQYFAFAGRKLRDQPWAAGAWRGRYSVIRDGAEVAFKEAEVEIAP